MKRIELLLAMLSVTAVLNAAPIRPNSFTVTQPDGSRLELSTIGDEYGVATVTTDGLAVTCNGNGVWQYVERVVNGKAVAGNIMAHDENERGWSETLKLGAIDTKGVRRQLLNVNSRQMVPTTMGTRAVAKPGDYTIRPDYTTTGTPKVLVVLVDFPDKKFIKDDQSMRNMYDTIYNVTCKKDTILYHDIEYERAPGSVQSYFEMQSFGVFKPSFDIVGPITAHEGYATYGKNDAGQAGNDAYNAQKLVVEICDSLLAQGLEMSQYDSNDDGILDMMAIIYAGNGENYSGSDPNTIWPHNWQIIKNMGDDVDRANYFLTCELFESDTDVIDGIGVFCHEFSHTIGLPDFYSGTSDDSAAPAMGLWSLMDYGVYEHQGFYPCGYTAFERFSVGWMDLPEAQIGENTLQRINDGYALRISTDDDNRFFVLENHRKYAWDSKQRTTGLMVTAVDYDSLSWSQVLGINKGRDNMRYYILPADNNRKRTTASQDLFPRSKDLANDSVTWNSATPLIIAGHKALRNIYDIKKASDGVISFTLEAYRGESTWVDSPNEQSTWQTGAQVYDLAGRRQQFQCDNLPKGIWIIKANDGTTRKVTVR